MEGTDKHRAIQQFNSHVNLNFENYGFFEFSFLLVLIKSTKCLWEQKFEVGKKEIKRSHCFILFLLSWEENDAIN